MNAGRVNGNGNGNSNSNSNSKNKSNSKSKNKSNSKSRNTEATDFTDNAQISQQRFFLICVYSV